MSTSKNKLSVQTLVRCAMIAAVYTVLCLVLQPFSYGAVQVRVAEAFCLLPVFGAEYIVGVTLGCLLANLLGFCPHGHHGGIQRRCCWCW